MRITHSPQPFAVTEDNTQQVAAAVFAILCGLLTIWLSVSLNVGVIGILVAIGLIVFALGMLFITETQTTVFGDDGIVTITYRRKLTGQEWVRSFPIARIRKIDYIKSFENSPPLKKWGAVSFVHLDCDFDEQIQIGYRAGVEWSVGASRIPLLHRSMSLDTAVKEIASYTKKSANTIPAFKFKQALENMYVPADKMRSIFKRPTQLQLNEESRSLAQIK